MWRQSSSRVTSALMPLGLSVRLMLDAIAFGSPCLRSSRRFCCVMGSALLLGGGEPANNINRSAFGGGEYLFTTLTSTVAFSDYFCYPLNIFCPLLASSVYQSAKFLVKIYNYNQAIWSLAAGFIRGAIKKLQIPIASPRIDRWGHFLQI